MKTLRAILLLLALTGVMQTACAQKGDFSDWNVPPPIPPGGINKGVGNNKAIFVLQITDVPPLTLPKTLDVQLAALTPLQQTPPNVIAPEQPQFPDLPFKVADIPLPLVPGAIALPKNIPVDEPATNVADFPVPAVPDMPDFPKVPDVSPGKYPDVPVPIPLVPALLSQPSPGILLVMPFPFTEWAIPSIPANVHFGLVLPKSPANIKQRQKTTKKPRKTPRRSN